MARSRSVPCTLFEDPNFFELASDAQIILIGLILHADDSGRGLAHIKLLSRKLDKTEAVIEQALHALVAGKLVCWYEVEEQHYYELTRWHEWETLSKPTASKYPAPPVSREQEQNHTDAYEGSPKSPGKSGEILGTPEKDFFSPKSPGKSEKTPLEVEEEEEEEEEKEEEGEGEDEPPSAERKVLPFPASPTIGGDTEQKQEKGTLLSHQLAQVLKLPISEGLQRLVEDYQDDSSLSLLGEADAAREWIDDPQRNRKRRQMSLAFFRRWVSREHEDALSRQKKREQASPGSHTASPLPRQSLMNLGAQYRASRQSSPKEAQHG